MRDFRWVSGQVAEVQRFINVPRRWCEQYPARERRELWITADQGPEFKFVVHTTLMPARRGHRVLALLMGRELVALHNLQTGESVNYLRSDPPLLWRRCEAVIAVLAAVGGIAAFAVVGPGPRALHPRRRSACNDERFYASECSQNVRAIPRQGRWLRYASGQPRVRVWATLVASAIS
jgi:hypothetical protein